MEDGKLVRLWPPGKHSGFRAGRGDRNPGSRGFGVLTSRAKPRLEKNYPKKRRFRSGMVGVLISFIYNLGLTNKPIKGPPWGVSACPHNNVPLVGLAPNVCVCGFDLSLSMTVVSPELWKHSSSWKRHNRTASDDGSSPGGEDMNSSPRFGAGVT